MYSSFYGFKEKPFTITPNPRFIFLSKNHREAFAHLLYGIDSRAGFILLAGEVGTGKTTVLRTLLGQLDEGGHRTALIFNPCLSAPELLAGINREFGLPCEGLSTGELLDLLYRFLLGENSAGRTVVLIIDEAQNLEPRVLEQIRLISNLETGTDKLIQIIMAGQPELERLLEKPELRQLAQRITVRYHLGPLDFADTHAYIVHRLEKAGDWRPATFTPPALKRIFRATGGFPRLINIICDRCLLIGYTEETREISGRMAAQAIREIRVEGRPIGHGRRIRLALACLLALLTVAGLYLLPPTLSGKPATPATAVSGKEAAGSLVLQRELARQGEGDSGRAYLLWRNSRHIPTGIGPGSRGEVVATLQRLLKESGFYKGEAVGVFDRETASAVRAFQSARGLVADGLAGGQTLLLLYRDSKTAAVPRLTQKGAR